MITSVSKLREMNYENVIGEIITWDIRVGQVPVGKIREALEDAKLGANTLQDLRLRSVFNRAMNKLKEGRLIDEVERDGDIIKFQLTRKEKREGCIDHNYDCIINLNTESGEITCPEDEELAKRATELLDDVAEHRSSGDLSRLVQRLFESRADLFSINPRKGVAYFVPVIHRDFSDNVKQFFTAVGGVLERFPVPDDGEGNASVAGAIDYGLADMGRELEQAIREWDDTTRESTKKKAAKKIEELRFKHQCYSEYLGAKQTDAEEQLASLTSLMFEVETAEEPAAEAAF